MPARPRSLRAPALRPLPPRCAGPPRGAALPPPGSRWSLGRAPPPLVWLSPALWPPVGGAAVPFGPGGAFRLALSFRVVLVGGASLRGAGFGPLPLFRSIGPSSGPGATFGGPGSLRPGPCVSVVPWVALSLRPLSLCVYRTYVLIGVEKPVECVYNRNKCRGKE